MLRQTIAAISNRRVLIRCMYLTRRCPNTLAFSMGLIPVSCMYAHKIGHIFYGNSVPLALPMSILVDPVDKPRIIKTSDLISCLGHYEPAIFYQKVPLRLIQQHLFSGKCSYQNGGKTGMKLK
jgi:hypothetical protein